MAEETLPKIKQPPVLFEKTQALVSQITALLGGTLITYWNNPQGSVCHNDCWRCTNCSKNWASTIRYIYLSNLTEEMDVPPSDSSVCSANTAIVW